MTRPVFSQQNLSPHHCSLLLQKCLKSKSLRPGKRLHALLLTTGTNMNIWSLNSKLLAMYASCGDLNSARKTFEKIEYPNVFALNWMVSAEAFNGNCERAIGYFRLLYELGYESNKFSFAIVLKALVGLMDLKKGKEVHAVVIKKQFESDVLVGNALIDMYCKCGNLGYARKVFDNMLVRDVASCTSMICGYLNEGSTEVASGLFERMKLGGLEPNDFTWNAMISGYARKGDCSGAFELFSRMIREGLVPDLVTWNALISGFARSQRAGEAFRLFRDMLVSGVKPNPVTVTGLLPACGSTGSLQRGKEIHCIIYRMELNINVFVASALIDMYSKCGSVKEARNVFENILNKNVASWNAIIGCYGKHGMVNSSLELFGKMEEEELQPSELTFLCILSACSHGGLVEKGLQIFRSMEKRYGLKATEEHYACVVDLLCRSGRMVEAYELIKEMPGQPRESIVGAFINGCKLHERSDLAKLMADEILRMEIKRPGRFVTLSNIYAAEGEWDEVENIRKVMKEKGVLKKPGYSWVEKRDGSSEVEMEEKRKKEETGDVLYSLRRMMK